jgi:hypothetical protein
MKLYLVLLVMVMKVIHFKGMHLEFQLKIRYYEININVAPVLCRQVCTILQFETLG